MRPLRFGILGCARIVRRAIAGALAQTELAEGVAIASRRPGEAAAWAAEYGWARAYDGYEALIADRDVDAVYIPLSNELHREWTLRAAAAGKHVLCEKPLAMHAAEAEEMVDGCRRAGVVLMEAFMWRHHPRVTRVREWLRDGALGQLLAVKMDFSFDIQRDDWRLDPRRGAGAVFDLGCYGINAARLFSGTEPTEVIARSRFHAPDVDMSTGLLLRFPGGVMGLVDCSFESPDRNRIEVVGTRGSVELPGGVLPAREAELVRTTAAGRETLRLPAADQYVGQLETFCQSVAAGRLLEPAEDGLANMRVIDRVRASAASAG